MKKIGRSDIIGQRGMAHIEGVVLSMGYKFYATGGVEAGIDGFIELRDVETGRSATFCFSCKAKPRRRSASPAKPTLVSSSRSARRTSPTGHKGRRRFCSWSST